MNSLTLRFRPIDVLFFRELRPQGGPGGIPLQSLFPPPPRTFSGTLHKLLHEATQTAFVPPNQRGGEATRGLENLRLRGPWLGYAHNNMDDITRLYPWPAHILRTHDGKSAPMQPSAVPIQSDLGRIYLPHLAADLPERQSYRSTKDLWLAEEDFFKLLADPHYQVAQCYSAAGSNGYANHHHANHPSEPRPLLVRETRLGIGRNNESRSAADGQLYQTCPIRPVPELVFDVQLLASYSHKNGHSYTNGCLALEQLKAALGSGGIVRLGSEGHSAHISVVENALENELNNGLDNTVEPKPFPALASNGPPPQHITVAFTTHADFGENLKNDFTADWKPQNFTRGQGTAPTAPTTWRGFPEGRSGVELEIMSAVCGKYVREGGWDNTLPIPGPRDARPLLPAGSVWFCRVLRGDARRLHGAQLGIGRELGRGEIAIGNWPT